MCKETDGFICSYFPLTASLWYLDHDRDFDSEMVKGESLFLNTGTDFQSMEKYWDILMGREGLVKLLKDAPNLTLESYKKFTIDIVNPKVRMRICT